MGIRTNQSGFSVIELVIVLLVVSIVGVIGYKVYNRSQNKTASSTSAQSAEGSEKATDVASVPTSVKTTSDLAKADKTLDATDPGSSNNSDSSQLDTAMAAF